MVSSGFLEWINKKIYLKVDTICVFLFPDKHATKTGRIPEWNKFDNSFFGITSGLIQNMDPTAGQLLESSFEAMVDAGYYNFNWTT